MPPWPKHLRDTLPAHLCCNLHALHWPNGPYPFLIATTLWLTRLPDTRIYLGSTRPDYTHGSIIIPPGEQTPQDYADARLNIWDPPDACTLDIRLFRGTLQIYAYLWERIELHHRATFSTAPTTIQFPESPQLTVYVFP